MMTSKAALLSSLNFEGGLKRPLKSRFPLFHLRNLPLQHRHHTYLMRCSSLKNSICSTFFFLRYILQRTNTFFFRFPHHHQLMTCWLLDLKVCALNHDRSFVPTYNCVWKKIEKKYTTMMKKKHCEASVENRIKIGSVNQRNKKK